MSSSATPDPERSTSMLSLLCMLLFLLAVRATSVVPEQIAVAAKGECCDMVVTWVTFNVTDGPQVKFNQRGSASAPTVAKALMTKFVDDGEEHVVRYIYRAEMSELQPSTSYDYMCGSSAGWSDSITMTTLGGDAQSGMVLGVYGDMGTTNAVALQALVSETDQGTIQGVLHVGDFAYDLDYDNGRNGDDFMKNIQPIASRIPYMVTPGNHEKKNNFSEYMNRYSMPGSTNGLYYSWNIGLLHIISLCTEFYFEPTMADQLVEYQHRWLVEDLQKANQPSQRAKYPWVISLGHRPMYCSTYGYDDCNKVDSKVRKDLEDVLYHGGVDLSFWGHNHLYQRQWPLYNYKVMNGSTTNNPYQDPDGLIHIITGAAGNHEKISEILPNQPEYVAFNNLDYSYTKMTVLNSTHINLKQINTGQENGKVVDEVLVVRTKHGPRQ